MRLYHDLADWFHLLTAPADYADEAANCREALASACEGPAATLLELGAGGGNNASHLKRWFACTLTDRSPRMLAQSRAINPECEHLEGDMRTLRLGRAFDLVFVHDAVSYLTALDDLRATAATAFAHLRPGGAALFSPDYTRESFRPSTDHGGHDGPDGRALRYLEWVRDADPDDSRYEVDMVYLLHTPDGAVRSVHDHCEEGLFTEAEWLAALRGAGFFARPWPALPEDAAAGQRLFLCQRPAEEA